MKDLLTGKLLVKSTENDGGYSYLGFEAYSGAWAIRRANDSTGDVTYAAGKEDLDTAWTGRAALVYKRPAEFQTFNGSY